MITTVKTSAALLKALKSAHSGDTILLAAGTYTGISLSGLKFPTGVTIASADPNHEAVITNLSVSNSSGLTFQQVALNTTSASGTAATVSSSSNITFSQDTFTGPAAGKGAAMMLTNDSGVTVTGSTFANFATGINAMTDSGLIITNNTFHGITGGAVRGTTVTASTISGNTFTDASYTVPTHTDVLYLWQSNTANSVTVSNNFYGPPLPAVLTTTAQLMEALQNAHAGQVIQLAAGTYSAVTISGYQFSSAVTITSADPTHPAVFTNLTVSNSSGLTFHGVTLSTTTGAAATVTGSQAITFTGDSFTGAGSGMGTAVVVSGSSGVTVTGSDVGHFGTGINATTDSNLSVTANTFHGITSGAVVGAGVTNSTVSNNTFADASYTVPTHTDVLNLSGSSNVTTSGNFFGPPLPSVITTTAQLIEALQNAHPGQVIQLAAGVYDAAYLSNFQFSSAVTITSADPTHEAVLTNLTVANSSGLTFQGVTLGTATGTAVTVGNSQAITFTGDTFAGPGAGTGNAMVVNGSTNVTVTGSDFGKVATGINLATDANLSVTNNTFHDISGGDIRGTGVTNSTISGNTFANANSAVTNHQDVLYLWQDNTANNVTISGNVYPAPALTNTQILVQDLQNAHAGDVIQLAAGTYDGAVLNNLNFATGVTITSADPTHEAVISNLTVSNSSGLVFEGVTLTTAAGAAATVTGSQNIGFSGDTFSGAGAGTALAVSGSSGVSVTGSDIGNFKTGLNLQTDSNVTVTGNNFHGNPGGGVVGSGVTASVINGNTFPDASSTNTAHTDVINLAQDNTANQVEINGNAYGSAHIAMVNSAQGLETALANAHAGDVIELAAGVYSGVVFESLNFAVPVTIMSADPANHAVLQNVWVNSTGLTFADLTFGTASATGIAADVEGSSNVTFDHDAFAGPGDTTGTALILRGDAGIAVTNSDVAHFNTGLQVVTSDSLTISNNTFEDTGVGAVRGTGVTNSTISGNDFSNADPTVASHQDVLYLWNQDNTANNVTISGNTYGSGSTAVTDSSILTGPTSSAVTTTTTTPIVTAPIVTTTPPAATVSGNVVTVNSASQLMAALQTAQGGDVIKLAAGSYGDLAFSGLHYSGAGVTITSADPNNEAVVNSVAVWGLSSGINLDHLTVQLPSTEQYGVQIAGASNINVSNMTIIGAGTAGNYNGTGVLVEGTNISVTHSDISQVNVGIENVGSTGVTVSNNSVHDISQDGLDTWGASNEVVSGNSFTNFSPAAGVHPDAIQFDQYNGTADSNILVEDNVITRGTGGIFQGIFVENTNHIEIAGNAMAGTMYNGISLSTTDNAQVSNNFVEGFSDEISWIVTRNVSSNVTLTNNQTNETVNYADGGVANPNYAETGTSIIAQPNVGDLTALNAWLAQHSPTGASLSDSFFLH